VSKSEQLYVPSAPLTHLPKWPWEDLAPIERSRPRATVAQQGDEADCRVAFQPSLSCTPADGTLAADNAPIRTDVVVLKLIAVREVVVAMLAVKQMLDERAPFAHIENYIENRRDINEDERRPLWLYARSRFQNMERGPDDCRSIFTPSPS